MKTQKAEQPARNTKRVYAWMNLPQDIEAAVFLVTDPDKEPREIAVRNHMRQVLEGLMQYPIYAASYCRISDQVLPLRRDHGVEIECKMYRNDPETGRERYGVYFLRSKVERVTSPEVA